MSSQTADEIKLDIDDIESLLHQAKRQKTKDLLTVEMRKLQTELVNLLKNQTDEQQLSKPKTTTKCYNVKLSNYAWDQSDKFVKLYVTLKNVQTLPTDNIKCDFTARSLQLNVTALENKNYELPISNLCEDIDPSKSHVKAKTDMIVVFLAKKSPINWSHVTGIEKRMKEAKSTPEFSGNTDPEASLMSLMKKMYQDGDDDMKRTIAKAWTESQEKRSSSVPDFPSF